MWIYLGKRFALQFLYIIHSSIIYVEKVSGLIQIPLLMKGLDNKYQRGNKQERAATDRWIDNDLNVASHCI